MTTGRATINRVNSQHSTGPVTEEGKRRSSMNALRRGILEAFRAEYDPQGITELRLTQSLIDLAWRLRRVLTLEINLLIEALATETQLKGLPR